MRKYLVAAAAAGGLLLLGAAPAHADERPAPGVVGGLLDPAGGIGPADGLRLDDPLGDAPLVDLDPGADTPSVVPALPAGNATPAARTGLGSVRADDHRADGLVGDDDRAARPAAEVVGGALPQAGDAPLGTLPVADLPGGGLPLLSGLLPDGRIPALAPADQESGLLGGDVPLLGGLGGLLPEEPVRTPPSDADDPDVSGMPAGGTSVPPTTSPGATAPDPSGRPGASGPGASGPAASGPAASGPAASGPGASGPGASGPGASGPGDDDKRLHEEPIDNEASNGRRFSDGRPVAGTDPDYR